MTNEEAKARLASYVESHPEQTMQSIAEKVGISVWTLTRVCKEHGIQRRPRVGVDTIARLDKE